MLVVCSGGCCVVGGCGVAGIGDVWWCGGVVCTRNEIPCPVRPQQTWLEMFTAVGAQDVEYEFQKCFVLLFSWLCSVWF